MLRLAVRTPRRTLIPTPRLALRSLSSSSRSLARPPSFTTPEPAPLPKQPQHDPAQPLEPLPPTNLPVEDYASPLLHTASFFSQLFRYAVFASVGIVGLSLSSLVAIHLYVEHVALAPPALSPQDDPDHWTDELDGWSGQHTGNGGTDPRLGLLARAAVRGAWISQSWGGGTVASPAATVAPAGSAQAGTPFGALARPGGTMIGARDEIASRGTPVRDAGWLLAEKYLVFALQKAAGRGISLVDSVDWEAHIEHGGVDRAAVELEERLAGLRERIGGRYKLEAAREGWERIYYALAASPTTDRASPEGVRQIEWERREKLKASRKLGELSGRIAEMWREGSDERVVENRKAEGWFVGGLIPVLAEEEGKSLQGKALEQLVPASAPAATKHATPKSSFFGFWSRSHPPSSPSPSSASSSAALTPELAHLLALVPSLSSPSSSLSSAPAPLHRALISTLISLETFLARRKDVPSPTPTRASLSAAVSVQSATQALLALLLRPFPPVPGAPHSTLTGSGGAAPLAPDALSRTLSHLYYLSRAAATQAHEAETQLALAALTARKGKGASAAQLEAAAKGLASAQGTAAAVVGAVQADRVLLALSGEEKEAKKVAREAVARAFGEQVQRVARDADKVEKMASGLRALVEELRQGKK
ncbi:hypothetical protein JCM10207_000944 [Rhodosporidiobolus poonsookiae]